MRTYIDVVRPHHDAASSRLLQSHYAQYAVRLRYVRAGWRGDTTAETARALPGGMVSETAQGRDQAHGVAEAKG